MEQNRLKIVIVGHVDHGKSTLIGRLFFDTNSLPEGKVEHIQKACAAEGMEFEYAFLLDALLEEQEQNITIDTTQIQFRTEKRNYVIIDAPGHKEFLKNMITGAASADAAILLIDAKEGVQEQSRRHGFLLSLLGVKQVIVAVNKMDLVDFNQESFNNLVKEYREFLGKLNVQPKHFIPVSAKHGHNITKASDKMGWFNGPAILEALDSFASPSSQSELPLRINVQDIYRFDERRIIAGKIETGTLRVGDELVFSPDRKRSRVKSIEWWNSKTPVTESKAGESVAFTLEEQIFVERGQIASHIKDSPIDGRDFKAKIFWLHDEPLALNQPYTLKLGTQTSEGRLVEIHRVIDSSTLSVTNETRSEIRKNEVAEVTIRSRRPMAFDNGDFLTDTGRFVIMQRQRIGGGGVIYGADYNAASGGGNLSWTDGEISRALRVQHFGHRGGVVWLTGLSGSGKSTLAVGLERALFQRGVAAFILDGDNLRHGLCGDLGFSDKDRAENIRRAGEVAKIMAESGLVVITALISPFIEERKKIRDICVAAQLPFAEVYVNAPLAECEKRDPKNLYKKARAGEIKQFTGIDSPYEAPTRPELELKTSEEPIAVSLEKLATYVHSMTSSKAVVAAEDQYPSAGI